MITGSEFFHAAKHALLSFNKPPGIRLRLMKKESDASRLLGLKSFSFVTIVPFFVSIMCVIWMERGTLHRGKGDLHRSSGMRGRCWIYVCDRWEDRIGLRGRMSKLFFLLILSCCPLVSWSSSIVGVVVKREKTFSPLLARSVFSIVLALVFDLFRFINAHSLPYRHSPLVK